MDDSTIYWIWYALRCGAGSAWGPKLLDSFPGGVVEIYAREFDINEKIDGIPGKLLTRLNNKDLDPVRRVIEVCMSKNIRIITCESDEYPQKLKNIPDFPIVLYARGRIADINKRLCVGVVGTRKMSDYGKHATFEIVRQLCPYNTVIVSGAAYGVDSTANRTALYFGADTVAVLGSGVDVPYPLENSDIIYEIADKGLLISEYIPGTRPNGPNFPTRNRIISGLSDALLVCEAPKKSGALITASLAADQGRKVYAVPSGIFNENSAGTNNLIRDGAKICLSAEEIFSDFIGTYEFELNKSIAESTRYKRYERTQKTDLQMLKLLKAVDEAISIPLTVKLSDKEPKKNTRSTSADSETVEKSEKQETVEKEKPDPELRKKIYDGLGEQERKVFDAMPDDRSVSADSLVSDELSSSDVMSALTLLELCSAVESTAGGFFRKII